MRREKGPIGPSTIVLGLLITIASLVYVRRNEQRLVEEAEHAFPGQVDAASPVSQGLKTRDKGIPSPRRPGRLSGGGIFSSY